MDGNVDISDDIYDDMSISDETSDSLSIYRFTDLENLVYNLHALVLQKSFFYVPLNKIWLLSLSKNNSVKLCAFSTLFSSVYVKQIGIPTQLRLAHDKNSFVFKTNFNCIGRFISRINRFVRHLKIGYALGFTSWCCVVS
ncbi:uncharacterized protein ASCRUDRAFT_81233 [Ascoidea rubescens DSM 1968]|uniref:Uncharacterized protein n=1 Tax=Ascoidea rubescens DSM 1968 TaxID=1344418 RepID=A0A1D2VGW4_9ASCO|nr:hypothetical protein ASCRUDRAFT_81233 [Ascoidea rubescens DSM 1968]ODV60894.1 hypothetical protein ASCRUDRAFT_81233 [Ascoidea rubescens DSM 1968]